MRTLCYLYGADSDCDTTDAACGRRITNLRLIGFSGNVFSSMSLEDSQSREQWDSSTKGISSFALALQRKHWQQFHSRENGQIISFVNEIYSVGKNVFTFVC